MINAYMIRNDGKEFPVSVHPYGSLDSVEETVSMSEWLYKHTNNASTKELIIELIATWAWNYISFTDIKVTNSIINYLNSLPYKIISIDFIKSLSEKLEDNDYVKDNIDELNKIVCEELNQEFLRVRIGGIYDSIIGNKDAYFRVSSLNFDWFNIIWNFVETHKNSIDTVTVVADEEATGKENYYYKYKNEPVDRMPRDEFLTLSPAFVIEAIDCYKARTVLKMYPRLKKNKTRIFERYYKNRYKNLSTGFYPERT